MLILPIAPPLCLAQASAVHFVHVAVDICLLLKNLLNFFKMKPKIHGFRAIHFLLFILILASFSACTPPNSAPNDPEPYPFSKINCYLRYMTQNRELQAEMTFRTDSTVSIEGGVLFNDENMVFKKLPKVGLQYRLIKNAVSFETPYTFSYTEKDGSKQEMSIDLNEFSNLQVVSDGISKTKGGLLAWEGEALGHEDGLILIFSDSKGNTFSINHTGISKGKQFEIIPDHANRLELGPATILTTRKKTVLTNENNVTKLISVEYYLKAIEFEVKE